MLLPELALPLAVPEAAPFAAALPAAALLAVVVLLALADDVVSVVPFFPEAAAF